jgi:hypothetical protein
MRGMKWPLGWMLKKKGSCMGVFFKKIQQLKIKKSIKNLKIGPRTVFIIDGSGAILSAFLLGVVLVQFQSFFGIPFRILYFLAAIPILFFLFDVYSYLTVQHHTVKKLKIIALANLLYCLLSISVTAYHAGQVTIWGWIYILIEILIVLIVVAIELATAKKIIH